MATLGELKAYIAGREHCHVVAVHTLSRSPGTESCSWCGTAGAEIQVFLSAGRLQGTHHICADFEVCEIREREKKALMEARAEGFKQYLAGLKIPEVQDGVEG